MTRGRCVLSAFDRPDRMQQHLRSGLPERQMLVTIEYLAAQVLNPNHEKTPLASAEQSQVVKLSVGDVKKLADGAPSSAKMARSSCSIMIHKKGSTSSVCHERSPWLL